MSYEYTDPGKGPRRHRNVSTRRYRTGWERIFGNKRGLSEQKQPKHWAHSKVMVRGLLKMAARSLKQTKPGQVFRQEFESEHPSAAFFLWEYDHFLDH